jgi:dipeptidyl aminopeptidase/acylaminoacyl peptidase
MIQKQVTPYGSWESPITSEIIVKDGINFTGLTVDEDNIYWIETRPAEGGRHVIVCRSNDGVIADVTPMPFNVRSTVHEYGGGAMAVSRGIVFFSNFSDQRLYRQESGGIPRPLTPPNAFRYADASIDWDRDLLFCVREDHTKTGEAVNSIVKLDLVAGGPGDIVIEGNDFYSSPRLSPNGKYLAWVTWNHPHMPWHGTELWLAEVNQDGSLTNKFIVAGGREESVLHPQWSHGNELYFASDRTGWWNLYRFRSGDVEPLHSMEAEFAGGGWALGECKYSFSADGSVICAFNQNGLWKFAWIDSESLEFCFYDLPFTDIGRSGLHVLSGLQGVCTVGSPTSVAAVVLFDLITGSHSVLRQSKEIDIEEGYLSVPEAIEFPTGNGLTAHAFFYPPLNRYFEGYASEQPPLLVISHGGPTGATSATLKLETQYWTTRGIAVVDVNYGGSTGYGVAYRQRLTGNWGIVDVDDCVNAAKYLIKRGDVDGDRLMIRGGSAGGYTTLAALTFTNVFKAGASYYGISDLEMLARDTHKYESRYLDSLIGAYPERRDLYIDRSPIHHVDNLSCPLILFQGLEDKVVPPNQAERMLEVLRQKGLPVAYVPFEGEQHGFRKSENIKRSMEIELYFYSRVFGFNLADAVEEVVIENLF